MQCNGWSVLLSPVLFLSLFLTLKKLLTEHDYIKMPFENYIQCPLKSHNENKTYICEKRENIVKIVAAQFFFSYFFEY